MGEKMVEWSINKKPPENICPQKYCFLWSDRDNKCRESFGECSRCNPINNNKDWYEPCEPELDRQGLPWFFFIASTEKVPDDLKEEYVRESIKLWGSK